MAIGANSRRGYVRYTMEDAARDKFGMELEPLLRRLYLEEGKNQKEIGRLLGFGAPAVCLRMKQFGIEARPGGFKKGEYRHPPEVRERIRRKLKGRKFSKETIAKLSLAASKRVGPKHPRWKGGRFGRTDGYVQVPAPPGHPFATAEGYIMEHRLVMERMIGRYLRPEEVVHHINGIRDDNRPENLMLLPNASAHTKLHARLRREANERDNSRRSVS